MEEKNSICGRIRILNVLIGRKLFAFNKDSKINKITGAGGFVLGYLAKNEGKEVFQRDIEKEFKIRRSTVTAIIKKLEENGFIERKKVESDGRLKKLVLTEKAYKRHLEFKNRAEDLEKEIKNALTEEEFNGFIEIADKLQRHMEKL